MSLSAAERRLDPTYALARQRFLEASERAGAETTSFPHPDRGREGEELAIDVAVLGPDAAGSVLVLVSGTHGVEGYAGSALQSWWLEECAGDPTTSPVGDLRVVLVHALNPVGFSWVRRVNEDNVDLNRNFVAWPDAPRNERYGEIAPLLVPDTWDADTQQSTTVALMEAAEQVGLPAFQEIVSSGQFDHPTGIFYGGAGPVWSNRWVREHVAELVGPARRVGLIDLHTGLGPWGHGELISHLPSTDPGHARQEAWWGEVHSMVDGDSVSAALTGDWLGTLDDLVPDAEVTAAALEFGTVDVFTVLQALRADAWLHAHGDPDGPEAAAIRAQVRAAFNDDDPAWLATLVERLREVIAGATRGLGVSD